MNKTKVAVLGCGFISEIHISSYQRFVHDAEVVAVYSHHLDKARPLPKKWACPRPMTMWTLCSRSANAILWTSACPTSCTTTSA